MTRRIAITILLTVWTILIAVGTGTYAVTRSVLLSNLDDSIAERAAALPEITDSSGRTYRNSSPIRADDRYIVRNPINQTLTRPDESGNRTTDPSRAPQILAASFATMPDGQRVRTLTLKAFARPTDGAAGTGAAAAPVTISFSGSAERFDRLTRELALALAVFGVAGGVLSAGIAWLVARAALRPLRHTADVIGTIDDRALDRRIETRKLPRELLAVGSRLNDMLERLEQAFAHRRRFLADAAHELRTPVAALITTMEVTLRRSRDADSYRQALETCLADARVLRALVESLMAQARSELPAFEEPARSIDLRQLFEQTTTALAAMAQQRQVRVQIGASLPGGLMIRTQPGRLRSVLLNLVGNAIEHNRAGGTVLIEAAVDRTDLRVRVTDTGPGIAAQHLPHLFDPFYRADKARVSGEGHLGLGLFLVKTHVDVLGGQCSVRSEVGVGTTFELLFPGALATPISLAEQRDGLSNNSSTQPTTASTSGRS